VESWLGLLGPAGLDPAIVARLNKEVAAVLADPLVLKQLAEGGMTPMQMAPADFGTYLAKERKALAAVIAANNIKAQ
jgi:tripartite-type tricarboxylate transporter receptor subunit TctC